MKLLGEQFAHDSPMLVGVRGVIEPYLVENDVVGEFEGLEHFIHWQAMTHYGMGGKPMDVYELANKWHSDRLPATVPFYSGIGRLYGVRKQSKKDCLTIILSAGTKERGAMVVSLKAAEDLITLMLITK